MPRAKISTPCIDRLFLVAVPIKRYRHGNAICSAESARKDGLDKRYISLAWSALKSPSEHHMTILRESPLLTNSPEQFALEFANVAVTAGSAIMACWDLDGQSRSKPDGSPVTKADLASHDIIVRKLSRLCAGTPLVSEEAAGGERVISASDRFILIDPLDGTKEFLARTGEFTVNIALIENRRPSCGVIYAPALSRLWWGGPGFGSYMAEVTPGGSWSTCREVRAGSGARNVTVAVASRSHRDEETEAFLTARGITDTRSIGSSLKFCLLAQGDADVYPRFGPTMEWDTAAGQAIVEGAGGRVETPNGDALTYGKLEEAYLNGPFIAWGK